MTRKDRVVLYGRLGLILMAFAMIGGWWLNLFSGRCGPRG